MNTILHQMRPWPPVFTRPMEDRPPFIVWPVGGLVAWAIILPVYMSLDHTMLSRDVMWGVFTGWCLGAGVATIVHYLYRR